MVKRTASLSGGRTAKPPQLRFRGLGTPVFPQESTPFTSPSTRDVVTELTSEKTNEMVSYYSSYHQLLYTLKNDVF
ncbi:hypothetical protein FGG79_08195 [Bacillus sp. BHET2]|uniref:hypothetical protein n=1 Tax=Bacillus sp. BHET2 TaxID=2583818 RepID=UPI00110E47DE|nr:hypothetical protein [Bacillus sp. BHET2]TMU88076.1 hypothetical protein FGG79_08195 [Bacillus sp. BHET2]